MFNNELLQRLLQATGGKTSKKAVDVYVQDQTTEIINQYMCNIKGTTTLTIDYPINTKVIVVASVTGAVVGDRINISENGRVFQSVIKNITGTTITMASPTDQALTTNAVVCFAEWNIAKANGSVTPVTYRLKPPKGVLWHVTKINFSITDNVAMDDTKFGGLSELPNGLVFRVVDGYTKQLGVISNNAGFKDYGFEGYYNDKTGAGSYGYNGLNQIKDNGVVLILNGDTDDEFQVIVNDDLTGLSKFSILAQGHAVED